jgi:phosphoglycerol transferase MdoB-like AlkP superfamily enzyme
MAKAYPKDKPTGYNVVFILMESWNLDIIDSFGHNGYGVTPYFDALAKDGLKFTRFYAAGQRSIDGIQSTLTGIPVLKGLPRLDTGIGVSNISRLGNIVKSNGYSTLFMQCSDRGSYKVDAIAAATGFDHYYGREDVPILLDYPDPDAAIFGWDYDTLQLMKKKIDGLKKPFMAYFFTGTTHRPYAVLPKQFMTHKPHTPQGINGYLNTLNYSDWSIGQFIAAAKKTDWFKNTIFIFTADHTTHTAGLQHANIPPDRFHTPFLIYAPGIIKPGESDVIGSQLDVMPTIIDLLGLKNKFSALGTSLFRKEDGGEAFVSMGGQYIGLINENGYVFNDMKERTATGGLTPAMADRAEQRLLAKDQLTYELLKKNKWAY